MLANSHAAAKKRQHQGPYFLSVGHSSIRWVSAWCFAMEKLLSQEKQWRSLFFFFLFCLRCRWSRSQGNEFCCLPFKLEAQHGLIKHCSLCPENTPVWWVLQGELSKVCASPYSGSVEAVCALAFTTNTFCSISSKAKIQLLWSKSIRNEHWLRDENAKIFPLMLAFYRKKIVPFIQSLQVSKAICIEKGISSPSGPLSNY